MTKPGVQIRPIKTDEDHRVVDARIEQSMSAAPGPPESAELDVISTFVDAYESKNYAIDAPITAIRFRMEQQGLRHTRSLS